MTAFSSSLLLLSLSSMIWTDFSTGFMEFSFSRVSVVKQSVQNQPCLAALHSSWLPPLLLPLLFFVFFFLLSTAHLKSRVIKHKNFNQAFKQSSLICPPRKVFYAPLSFPPLLPSIPLSSCPPPCTSLCLLNALMHDGLNLIDVQRASERELLACACTVRMCVNDG